LPAKATGEVFEQACLYDSRAQGTSRSTLVADQELIFDPTSFRLSFSLTVKMMYPKNSQDKMMSFQCLPSRGASTHEANESSAAAEIRGGNVKTKQDQIIQNSGVQYK